MARLVDCKCQNPQCGRLREVICAEGDLVLCNLCNSPMEQQWWTRNTRSATVWHPDEWATIFKKPDGTFKYPGRADVPTPEGCERITIRSDAEMAQHERLAGVRSERRWFDRGSGRGFDGDETMRPMPRRVQ